MRFCCRPNNYSVRWLSKRNFLKKDFAVHLNDFSVWIYSRCTTNVEIEITDRPDAGMVKGRHNLLFCGVSAYLKISH